jgi:hypothetical protein
MKRKMDFVTNSSSCAFIFIGWVLETGERVNEVVKEQMEIFGTKEYDPDLRSYENLMEVYDGKVDITLGDGENGLPDGKLCIGLNVRIHDDDYESHEYSIQDVLDIDPKLADTFHTDDIKIISGTELC